MMIRDAIDRDLTRRIEEVVKVEQEDQTTVHNELTDYVATDRIKDHYRTLLREIAGAKSEPHDGIGVWVSGFFGSGKSSFAKNLGSVLANPTVLGASAADLFKQQLNDPQISALIDSILTRIPTETIQFDVRAHTSALRGEGRITELMYRALLRHLDYAEDFDLADLEIALEAEGRLDAFVSLCQTTFGVPWHEARNRAEKYNRAGSLLAELDPKTYPTPDSWVNAFKARRADISIDTFVDRLFDLMAQRRPGKTLMFILDEVGAYVARSADKIEDLRSLVERIGMEGRNRVLRGTTVAPIWVVVTSQEKLDEVVAAIDSKRVELARLQDRFKFTIDLTPTDIREVASRGVLAKTEAGASLLRAQYRKQPGQLNAALRWERTTRPSQVSEDEFIQFYPYPPHYIDLSINIMSGIRLQPGAQRQIGGSNRTIIKQAYEMLVSEKTRMADKPLGTLVTLDKLYDLVEGSIASEKQLDINQIRETFHNHPEDTTGITLRVAKCLCLLEFVRDLPRTPANLAACLVDSVGDAAPVQAVQQALDRLEQGQFIRNTDQGWKLQTAYEKNWDNQRRSFLSPRPRDRNDILREILRDLFIGPDLKTFRHKQKTFKVAVTMDGTRIGDEGDIPLALVLGETIEDYLKRRDETRKDSRQPANEHSIFWVFALTPEIDAQIGQLYASRQMVALYEQMRAQSQINHDDASLLQSEKTVEQNHKARLREKVESALAQGVGIFRGLEREGPGLGAGLAEILRRQFEFAVPDLYAKFDMGNANVKSGDVEDVLKAANLNGLPPVFYGSEGGLNLVIAQEGGRYVINTSAPIAAEVLGHLRSKHEYGDKVTGRLIDEHFTGLGYGWDRSVVQLTLAALLRGGAIEVTHQGRRYRSHADPLAREPFTNQTAFKAASFAPRAAIDLKTLTTAVRSLEEMTGEEVDIEEGAIASAFQQLAEEEQRLLLPVLATVQANRLPGAEALLEYRVTLTGVLSSPSDDCVRTLAGEGQSFQEARKRLQQLQRVLDADGLASLNRARVAAERIALLLRGRTDAAMPPGFEMKATALSEWLFAADFYTKMDIIRTQTEILWNAYQAIYADRHKAREDALNGSIKLVKSHPEWPNVDIVETTTVLSTDEGDKVVMKRTNLVEVEEILSPLTSRQCRHGLDVTTERLECRNCESTLREIETDIAIAPGLAAGILAELDRRSLPPPNMPSPSGDDPVLLASFFPNGIDTEEAFETALAALRAYVVERLREGKPVTFA